MKNYKQGIAAIGGGTYVVKMTPNLDSTNLGGVSYFTRVK
jgi:hypothetical protein